MINPLLVSTSDLEGGASRATYRLHRALQKIGIRSQLFVQSKTSEDPSVLTPAKSGLSRLLNRIRPGIDRLPLQLYPGWNRSDYCNNWLPNSAYRQIRSAETDIANIHWICEGFVQLESLLKIEKPIVFTLHDMWFFTGGCNYANGCQKFTSRCGECPQLKSNFPWDISRWNWLRRASLLRQIKDIAIVTPSRWLAEEVVRNPSIATRRIEVIPNGIDITTFKPINRTTARELLQLPKEKFLVLFGAVSPVSNKRKGFDLLLCVLKQLRRTGLEFELIIFGSSHPTFGVDFGFPTHSLGRLRDELSLVLAYNAADLFIAPSMEDNLPNTILESLACGTPCVAFSVGGMPDMIEHRVNGFLARPFDVEHMAQGIAEILLNPSCLDSLRRSSRLKIEQKFSDTIQAQRYNKLFEEVLASSGLGR